MSTHDYRTFAAKHASLCSVCREGIHPGDSIRYSITGQVRHDVCPNDPDTEPAREICRTCWLERSIAGTCGCEDNS